MEWIDDTRLYVHVPQSHPTGTRYMPGLIDKGGEARPNQFLPAVPVGAAIQPLDGGARIYVPVQNRIYDMTTREATWTGPQSLGVGAVAGPSVTYELQYPAGIRIDAR
jgi:hypothetical protein